MDQKTESAIEQVVGIAVGAIPGVGVFPGAKDLAETTAHLVIRLLSGESVESLQSSPLVRASGVDWEALRASVATAAG